MISNRFGKWTRLMVVAAVACVPAGVFAAEVIRPAGAFNITEAMPPELGMKDLQIHKLIARNGSLYFLVSAGPSADDGIVLQTDLYGGYKSAVRLGTGTVRDVDVDERGNTYVLFGYPEDRTVVYNTNGEKTDDQPSPGAMSLVFMKGRGLSHIYFDGHLTIRSGNRSRRLSGELAFSRARESAAPTRLRHVAFPSHKLALVEGVSATMQILDGVAGTRKLISLTSPEIERAKQYYNSSITDPNLRGIILVAAAGAEDDTLYFLIGAYEDAKGATILHVDGNGNTLGTFQCPLPPSGPDKTSKMLPSDIAITGGELFIAGISGTVAAYYIVEGK